MPAPSPRTYPSARASKARDRLVGDRKPPCDAAIVKFGVSIRFTPPARAVLLSPDQRDWQARWTATSDDEQAVSSATLGPSRLNACEIRLASIVMTTPVAVCVAIFDRSVLAN